MGLRDMKLGRRGFLGLFGAGVAASSVSAASAHSIWAAKPKDKEQDRVALGANGVGMCIHLKLRGGLPRANYVLSIDGPRLPVSSSSPYRDTVAFQEVKAFSPGKRKDRFKTLTFTLTQPLIDRMSNQGTFGYNIVRQDKSGEMPVAAGVMNVYEGGISLAGCGTPLAPGS